MPGKKNLRMKAARAAVGLSQADLAEALCVAICKALRVTLNDLFWEDGIDVDPNAL